MRGGVVEVKVVAVWGSCLGALLVVAIWLLGGLIITGGKFEGMAQICVDTNTGDGNLGF